ncbi:DUF1028 domain-containing protein [Mycolicibacterium nivoides]|uniref:DUF1028 domain-containing protein n=1 Tax=Mycolicibacterium nivoides TaxID=2487344 RepID=A0ABW9LJL5_9MYCO|nr:DUF1028 domain-containing protein [Mycolicibacterium nivoides]MBN3512184.1 DUF1028 domain-containing protein [Mycolicibacterium septicum]SEP66609.1 Uncharacterized conserved protein, Ntn-hydrolase superfamily [Mycobacterium sp. 88mf]SFF09405.1 Uncharacterized conserved protein, Ntn-hydrolase superfamily [Mycobacterium sp. 455mf]
MTFSLAGRCSRTGMFGAVVTSSSPAVAARCVWARSGVGVACTQNVTDPTLGSKLLDRLAAGADARGAMDQVVASAAYPEYRQLTVIDAAGNMGFHSGACTLGTHTVATGLDVIAAGNLLSSDKVPQAMVEAFEAAPDEHLGDRLLAGLRAGEAAGGEEGPVHSCGLLVVFDAEWPLTDLRVDWDDDPITRLEDIWSVWQPQAQDYTLRARRPDLAPSYGVPGDE